jgi:hypothetical protein
VTDFERPPCPDAPLGRWTESSFCRLFLPRARSQRSQLLVLTLGGGNVKARSDVGAGARLRRTAVMPIERAGEARR